MIYETHLRDIRRTQRLTLRQLSELSGVSFSEIDQIERYNVDPRISTAVLLAKSLKCGLDDLTNNVRYYKHACILCHKNAMIYT